MPSYWKVTVPDETAEGGAKVYLGFRTAGEAAEFAAKHGGDVEPDKHTLPWHHRRVFPKR